MTPAAAIVAEVRTWLGCPYLHQGRNRRGVDCVGLVIAVCDACGVTPPGFTTGAYGRIPANDMLRSRIAEHCSPLDRPLPGAMVVIRWTREASHVAIFTGSTLIHSYQHAGRVIEHGYRGRWLRMTDSVWALPGVTYV